ncbi:copper resistance system multicopper oxidase [Parvibaculaceae bacterium PLY_AMNH_Bact1]|nr:copper resistance system multicopper oxidase [Parvibaculaceae bacterium PLY_AMNH_Bact1]
MIGRRQFLASMAALSTARPSFAGENLLSNGRTKEYALSIDEIDVNFTGKLARALAVNGQVPGPALRFRDGDDAVIHVTNNLDVMSSIHWHGLLVPPEMDGVPGVSFKGISPGETFTYRFPIRQTGTYWYHSHSAYQEQQGVYGSLIIEPRGAEPAPFDREHTIVLSDWLDTDPADVHANLKSMSDYYNYAQRTVGDFFDFVSDEGLSAAANERLAWGNMRMTPTDLSDVSGYTFLLNGLTTDQPWFGEMKPGECVRLRFINAGAMSYFDVRIPGLKMTVVEADGQAVVPVPVDEFRIAVAETYDVIVEPQDDTSHQIIAEAMDRSGFAIGQLGGDQNERMDLPASRSRSLLSMDDMGGDHGRMDHGQTHSGASESTPKTDHSMMDHAAMGHAMPMAMAAPVVTRDNEHVPPVYAPEGARVLTYQDLVALIPNDDLREPDEELTMTLGGNMERYIWTLNGDKFSEATPIYLEYGQRVRITYVNETMMNHPMHLHGMFVELENGQPPETRPRKHIVNVGPGRRYSVTFTADEAGEWAFHCHLLYHMASGMMSKMVVSRVNAELSL